MMPLLPLPRLLALILPLPLYLYLCICVCVYVLFLCSTCEASATHSNPGFQENINDISQNVAAHTSPKQSRREGKGNDDDDEAEGKGGRRGLRAARVAVGNPLGCTKAEPQ